MWECSGYRFSHLISLTLWHCSPWPGESNQSVHIPGLDVGSPPGLWPWLDHWHWPLYQGVTASLVCDRGRLGGEMAHEPEVSGRTSLQSIQTCSSGCAPPGSVVDDIISRVCLCVYSGAGSIQPLLNQFLIRDCQVALYQLQFWLSLKAKLGICQHGRGEWSLSAINVSASMSWCQMTYTVPSPESKPLCISYFEWR